MSAKKIQYSEEIDPKGLDAIASLEDPTKQYIVKLDFYYCGVTYSGYEILTREEIGMLQKGLRSGVKVGTWNMPDHWHEEFDISELDGAFSIHSSDPSDIDSMIKIFGTSVGETSYFATVLDAARASMQYASDENCSIEDWSEYISDEAAESLSTHRGDVCLGVKSLTDSAASSLSKIQGVLRLPDLEEVSENTLEILSNHEGGIALNSIEIMSDELINAFSKCDGLLNIGIHHLTENAAIYLSTHKGDLELDSITEITDAAAEALSKHQGDLGLMFMEEISIQSAEYFSKHLGDINFESLNVTPGIAKILAKKQGTICREAPADWVAWNEVLSKYMGWQQLNDMTELSDADVEALSKYQGSLELNGLTKLSNSAAEALSKHQGALWLRGLTELSKEAIAALAGKVGTINDQDPAEWVRSIAIITN
jgi:hypothetical protein